MWPNWYRHLKSEISGRALQFIGETLDCTSGTDLAMRREVRMTALDRWLETAAKPKLKARTYRDSETLLKRYVRPSLEGRPLAKATPLDVQAVYGKIIENGLSARTVRYTHAVLRSALQQAVN